MEPELRQLRYFVAVAEHHSFTRAAEELFVAQQALSQQIKVLEDMLGVRLLDRTSRKVELTTAGAAYLADCKRLLAAASRARERVRAIDSGVAGKVRVAYTLTAVYDTLPRIVQRMAERQPQLTVETREIFAADVHRTLHEGRYDVAIAPADRYPKGIAQRLIRREPLLVAMAADHPLAGRASVELAELDGETFELWPRDMAPGYYDAVVGACRAAGFEPRLDDTASGSTAWAGIAAGRGVNLAVSSLAAQPPRGIVLRPLNPPCPVLGINAVWPAERRHPAVGRLLAAAAELGAERDWEGAGRAPENES
jgi:DNA-binding transcriptional LysR family regulator